MRRRQQQHSILNRNSKTILLIAVIITTILAIMIGSTDGCIHDIQQTSNISKHESIKQHRRKTTHDKDHHNLYGKILAISTNILVVIRTTQDRRSNINDKQPPGTMLLSMRAIFGLAPMNMNASAHAHTEKYRMYGANKK